MGPPELPGGNFKLFEGDREVLRVLQWGRRNYPAETAGERGRGSGRSRGFNGAAGITRRKQAGALAAESGAVRASMGPPELPGGNMRGYHPVRFQLSTLQWGRRNYPAETTSTTRIHALTTPRFNGAAGITRRKQKRWELPQVIGKSVLQWGRRNYPAETSPHPDAVRPIRLLQWGRRNYPAETRQWIWCARHERRCFNGAAGITRRKRAA